MRNLLFLVLFIVLVISTFVSKANDYTITITDANHHLAEVEVVFKGVMSKAFSVKLPVWRTGKYQILDLVSNIRHFKAFDAKNKPLTFQKDDKNTWRIFVNTPGVVKVRYQIYANKLRSRVSHIDSTHAFLDASGVFVYSESQRDKPLTVKLNVPESWRSVSGMDSIAQHHFKADNYDQLVDSPIESGIHVFDSIKVEEQTYEIVIWGEGNYDMQRLKKDIEKLHYQAKNIWKTFPFKRYVYMYHVGDKLRGATEHVNSTIIQADRFGFYPDEKYRKIIATTAHEFVHTWNVKSYRPAGISPYDYSKENYSDLFWMAEGKTSYYDNLFAVRAEIFTVEEYLENIAKDIHRFTQKPGRTVMSLTQTSFDTWLPNDANRRHNTTVSIYLKGALVSWLLDTEIRLVTNNEKDLDDLSYLLYKNYANSDVGYSSYDVKQLLKELTRQDFSEFWSDYVEGTKAIDFEALLNFYGLSVQEPEDELKLTFGINIVDSPGYAKITLVKTDSPAWNAGLEVGDSIVAINGLQVTEGNLDEHLENLKLNTEYTLHYFNQGQLKQTQIVPSKAPQEKLKIIQLEAANDAQKLHFDSWLKQDYSTAFKKSAINEQ
ncbi:MAG: PDZ domain-containing protein [Proteobacteria bacterium]|nr:PDZ domain-containing protein [Pseudomonadota bacterium]